MFSITSTAVLFSILSTFVNAAPLPMPAVKQSEQLASRYYNHPDTTPCWSNGLQGITRDGLCVLATLDVQDNRYVPAYQPGYIQGQPCSLNGQPGFWQDAVCVLANLNIDLNKKDFIPFNAGQACWLNGRRGYFTQDGLCDLVDLNLIADVNNGPTFLNNGPPVANNDPCWLNGKQGFWRNNLCVLADLDIAKRAVTSGGLVGDVLDTLTGYEDCYNCGPGPTRHAVLPTDDIVDAEALVDVNNIHNDFPYKRNGLVHNAPDGNEVDGAVRTVTQLLDHSVTKRGLLGINDVPIVDDNGLNNGYTYYPNGYVQPQYVPVVDNTLASVEAQVNVDEGDEPYYGTNYPHYLNGNGKGNGLLGLKRDILGGNGDNTLGGLSNLGNVLESHHRYSSPPSSVPSYLKTPNGQILPYQQGPSDVLAEVSSAVDIDGLDVSRYPYGYTNDGRAYYRNGNNGVLHGFLGKKDLGGLSGVNGLGLNKDGSFPEGLDVVPKVGDLLGAGKHDNTLGGLGNIGKGKSTNGLTNVL
ncbi:uncharacterized protein L201_002394 [Kwoniella dendrophila CBS 6074]|uniref:Uncharacterized protein n=1 Tax=Kwoniella dendrophila CBS 6074 TaxID=1295534 RepID=A0AAX4JRW5_9TREE